jgi:uncharacterized protein YjdB
VTVTQAPVIVPITGVTLNKSTLPLVVGATETLIATVLPSNATYRNVNFTSNSPAVADVDNSGRVVANTPGQATITVYSDDYQQTATALVTVTATPLNYSAPTITAPAAGSTVYKAGMLTVTATQPSAGSSSVYLYKFFQDSNRDGVINVYSDFMTHENIRDLGTLSVAHLIP